jgi:transcriptional regulator GlxA family with amidase domain
LLIAFFMPPNGHSIEVSGPSDVFAEANRQLGRRVYDIRFISDRSDSLTCFSGLRLVPDRTIYDPDEPIDTLLVAGAREPLRPSPPDVIEWLKRRCPAARRYGSVCTGAFLLGAAGLLAGKRVTTHWEFAAALSRAHPTAVVEPDRIFVRDGAMVTSAGVSAGIDLALALVEEDLGRRVALSVARWLVVFLKRPGGQSQFSAHLASQAGAGSPIERVQEWVRNNLLADLSVASLAQQAHMSRRNFVRAFRRETGMTPIEYVEAIRVEMARGLLEETNLPLQRVALRSGFANTERLRRAFVRRLGVRPLEYRSRFRGNNR